MATERPSNGAQELTRARCIVCGERAGNVAILRIARCRFCFRSLATPDRFLPSPAPPPSLLFHRLVSLSRESSSSRQECARTLSSGTARQRGVMYDLTESFCRILSFSPLSSLSPLSSSLREPARISGKIAMHVRARILFLRTVHVRMPDIAV